MKTLFKIFLLLLVVPFSSFSQSKDTITKFDTVKPSKRHPIWLLMYNTPHYFNVDKTKLYSNNIISFDLGNITQINDTMFNVTPTKKGKGYFRINKNIYKVEVKDIPTKTIILDGPRYDWKESEWIRKISLNEIKKISEIKILADGELCNIYSFNLSYYNNNGEYVKKECKGDTFPKQVINDLLQLHPGDYFEISTIYGSTTDLIGINTWPIKYKIIKSDLDEIICNLVNYIPNSSKLDILKTDLRIKIEGNPSHRDIQTVKDVVADLDTLLETIDVKIVDSRPSLTIYFDTSYNVKRNVTRNFFFPYIGTSEIHLNTKINSDWMQTDIWQRIIERLANFNTFFRVPDGVNDQSSDSCSTFNWRTKPGLSNLDRLILKRLFSKNGENEIIKTLKTTSSSENNNEILLIIVVCGILILILYELNRYYNLTLILNKLNNSFIKRIIESVIIAQLIIIATLIFYLLAHPNSFMFDHLKQLGSYELYFCSFTVILGLLLLFLDKLLRKIKTVWLNLCLDFILTFLFVALTYQIILFSVSPMMINLDLIDWQLYLIPFGIMLYRFFMKYEKNKITGLLQEKELELANQKELKLKSDLNALQSRINPHFLYNSLNSIATLSHIDADRTENMALALSRLFRYNINRDNDYIATIGSEIEMVKIYLDLEKNRFEDKLEYTINVKDELIDFEIPKFLLQPLVENAIKHGISKITEKGLIEVRIFDENKSLIIEIYDNGPEFQSDILSGYGLQNVQDKLKILYKKPFYIEFVNEGRKHLKITLQK